MALERLVRVMKARDPISHPREFFTSSKLWACMSRQKAVVPMRDQMQDKASLAAALQLRLGLNPTEAQIAMRLITQGRVAREQICGMGIRGHRSVKAGSVGAIVGALRKKLAGYGITIGGINSFGFALRQEDRAKVLELLAARKHETAA
jgi:hypothetical protein